MEEQQHGKVAPVTEPATVNPAEAKAEVPPQPAGPMTEVERLREKLAATSVAREAAKKARFDMQARLLAMTAERDTLAAAARVGKAESEAAIQDLRTQFGEAAATAANAATALALAKAEVIALRSSMVRLLAAIDQARREAATAISFNEAWYLATYPDVLAAVQAGTCGSGFEHYLQHGRAEGRPMLPPT